MSTGGFLREYRQSSVVLAAISLPSAVGCVYVDSCIHIPCGSSWPVEAELCLCDPGSLSARHLTMDRMERVRSRGGDFASLLCVQTGPGVNSASYKMSTGGFPGVQVTERGTTHPTSS